MNSRIVGLAMAMYCTATAGAIDIAYSVSADAGASMAFGGDLSGSMAEFGSSIESTASYAPVIGASFALGLDLGLYGPLRAVAGIEARRLGYAFWASDVGASSWLALWTASLRLGLRYAPDSWYLGAGGMAGVPLGGASQGFNQGSASLNLSYDANSGRPFIPGAYLEGGISLGYPFAIGSLLARPVIGLEAGLWPTGIARGVEAWQTALSLVVSIELEKNNTLNSAKKASR